MAKFKITDQKTGKTVTVSGEKAPSEQEAEEIFKSAGLRNEQQPQQFGSPLMNTLAGVQTSLGKSETLPVGGAILGGLIAGPPGAAIGATTGKVGQQQLAEGAHLPTQEEANKSITTGGAAGILDLLGGKLVQGAGKLLKGVVTKVDEAFKPITQPLVDKVNRFILSETLSPAANKLAKDLTEEGINKTFQEASERGLAGKSPQELYVLSNQGREETGKAINQFVVDNADNLPKINVSKVTSALDDEISRLDRLAETDKSFLKQSEGLKEIKKNLEGRGEISFDEAWTMTKDFGDQVSSYYNSGKSVADIKPYKAKAFKILNDTMRRLMKEESDKAGLNQWSKMADDYHFYKNLGSFAESAVAKSQTAVNPSLSSVTQKALIPSLLQMNKTGQMVGDKVIDASGRAVEPVLNSILQGGVLPQVSGR